MAAAQPSLSERDIKAAFVLNFVRYVDWPEHAFTSRSAPALICLLGRDLLAPSLGALEGRVVNGRVLQVRRDVTVDEARSCQVVFIAQSEEKRLATTLRALAERPILSVSDIEGFVDAGGAIGIVYSDERMQFEVNRNTLDQARLKASSNLLRLARNAAEIKGSH